MMTRQVLPVMLSLSVIGMTASAAFAQTSQSQNSSSRLPVEAAMRDSHKLQITEDLEIMRRLLDATVKELYASGSARPVPGIFHFGNSSSSKRMDDSFFQVQGLPGDTNRLSNLQIRESIGTYLSGHGVVYQLELPPLSEPPNSAKTVAKRSLADCPFMLLSKWDRTRKQLSGELKTINCSECHASKNLQSADAYFKSNVSSNRKSRWITEFVVQQPSASVLTREELTARLIDLLAENGHHFRALSPSQYVTLAVTFRDPAPAPQATPMMMGGMSGMMGDMSGGSFSGMIVPEPSPGMLGALQPSSKVFKENPFGKSLSRILPQNIKRTQKKNTNGIGAAGGSFASSGADSFGSAWARRLGDTLAKVGNEELAGDLHMRQGNPAKAIVEYEKAIKKFPQGAEKETRRLRQKLSQAYIASGSLEKAKQFLETLIKEDAKKKPAQKPVQPQAITLPARLVISVTKANLVAVAAEPGIYKISREQFRKQVSVDYFDPASVKPKTDNKQQSKP